MEVNSNRYCKWVKKTIANPHQETNLKVNKYFVLPRSNNEFHRSSAIFCGKITPMNYTLHISEGPNTNFMVLVHFIYFLGFLFAHLNAFLQKPLDIIIQIFRSKQNFLRPWIDKINTFSMSEQRIYS